MMELHLKYLPPFGEMQNKNILAYHLRKTILLKELSKEKTFFKNCIEPKNILPKKDWYKKFDKYWNISEG